MEGFALRVKRKVQAATQPKKKPPRILAEAWGRKYQRLADGLYLLYLDRHTEHRIREYADRWVIIGSVVIRGMRIHNVFLGPRIPHVD
ncbi:MAG: hypothetical protein OXC12_00945, partial [Spirochaetaceae bacterium]|nr:hypothetical protein [Spirochaetaceae bacterium]